MSGKLQKFYKNPDTFIILSGVLIVYLLPEYTSIQTGCIFYKITGYYCAGCGLTRAIRLLLRGDIFNAMHMNLLFVTAIPLSVLLITFRTAYFKHSECIKTCDNFLYISFIIITIIFMIMRNLPYQFFSFLRPV